MTLVDEVLKKFQEHNGLFVLLSPASVRTRMTNRTDRMYLNQQSILVAILFHGNHVQEIAALRSLLAFHGKKDISFAEVDSRLVDAYGEWLRRKGICKDTLSCYMRSLRAVYNKAVEQGLTEQKEPFVNVFTGISRTRKRSIEKADINKLRAVQVKPGSFMQLVRDVFLFCFYACGMPFVDVAFLKKSQIKGGILVYHRRKTDQVVQIKLEPCMQEIINRYRSDGRS